MKQAKQHQRLIGLSRFLLFVAVIVLTTGLIVTWQQLQSNQTASSPRDIQTIAEAQPSAEKQPVDHFAQHTVAPALPRYIFIDKISVKAIVKPLGVTADNYLEAPANIHEVGWYNGSTTPGQAGAVVIDGHVGLSQTPGVFFQLHKLQPNDTITIERGDGTLVSYRVTKSITYEADDVDMHTVLNPVSNQPGLNLITCAGSYNIEAQTFDQRLVVYTEQVS